MMPSQTTYVVGLDDIDVVQSPIDFSQLRRRCMGNPTLVSLLLEQFRQSVPPSIAEIERLVQVGDTVAVSDAAHSLRGAAGIIAARPVADIAGRLEDAGRSGRTDHCRHLVGELRTAVDRCLAHLDN